MSLASVDLPAPVEPTSATVSPGLDVEVDVVHDLARPVAEADPSNSILPMIGGSGAQSGGSASSGSTSRTPKIFSRAAIADWNVL